LESEEKNKSRSVKKILISFSIILILIVFVFFGSNHFSHYLASLSGAITAWVTINPLGVDVSAPSEVEINKIFLVRAKVINKGKEKIENVEAEIFLPEKLKIKKDEEQEIGTLPPHKEKIVIWPIRGDEAGNYIISVKTSGELKEKEISAQDSVMVEVKEFFPKGREWFQNLSDFFQKWFRF